MAGEAPLKSRAGRSRASFGQLPEDGAGVAAGTGMPLRAGSKRARLLTRLQVAASSSLCPVEPVTAQFDTRPLAAISRRI